MKRSAVDRYLIGFDHRADSHSDEKSENQRRAHTRANDDGAATPVVATIDACLCMRSKHGYAGTHQD